MVINPVSWSCLAVVVFWFLDPRRGWAGLLGVLGRDWIVPAATPVPRLPSLGHTYRSCRSNQSFFPAKALPEFLSSSVHLPCPLSVFWLHCIAVTPSKYKDNLRWSRPAAALKSILQMQLMFKDTFQFVLSNINQEFIYYISKKYQDMMWK